MHARSKYDAESASIAARSGRGGRFAPSLGRKGASVERLDKFETKLKEDLDLGCGSG